MRDVVVHPLTEVTAHAFHRAAHRGSVARERSMSENIFNPAADLARNGRIENLFPTPLFSYVFREVEFLNAELRDLILERERTTKSAKKSNIGGWQSDVDFLSWDGPAVATLGRYMSSAVLKLPRSSCRSWHPSCRSGSNLLPGPPSAARGTTTPRTCTRCPRGRACTTSIRAMSRRAGSVPHSSSSIPSSQW